MKLYEAPQGIKIYEHVNGEPGYIIFGHLDGMYSYCTAYTLDGQRVGICHLACFTPLEPHEDGYKIAPDDHPRAQTGYQP